MKIRWKDLKHPELHPKATDELMPCDFQNDCSGLWCLWHILWIKALRNTNNVLNGNTKVGINKRFRTLACSLDKNSQKWFHAMSALSVSFVWMRCLIHPVIRVHGFTIRWMMLTSSSSSLTRWRWWDSEKTGNHFDGMFVQNQVYCLPTNTKSQKQLAKLLSDSEPSRPSLSFSHLFVNWYSFRW